MHRIDTTTAETGGFWRGSSQILQQLATKFSPAFMNDIQENICKFIESLGITLQKGNYDQLTEAINAGYGKKRNLNFNPAFFVTQKWGGLTSITPNTSTKTDSTGWNISHDNGSNITVYPSVDGLVISGTSTSSDMTISLSQTHSTLNDAAFGNNTFTSAGETKQFTVSAKYEKVSGINFTVESKIESISSSEAIIKNEIGNSSVESIGMAYKHTQVNTKDLSSTPVTGVGLDIKFAASGAFEINIKNCDLTEGFNIPDFQTYGNYIADQAFAVAEYGLDSASGSFSMYVPVRLLSFAYGVNQMIPIPSQDLSTDDTLNVTNLSAVIYGDSSETPETATIAELDVSIKDDLTNPYAQISFEAEILASKASPVCLLTFDWTWTKN